MLTLRVTREEAGMVIASLKNTALDLRKGAAEIGRTVARDPAKATPERAREVFEMNRMARRMERLAADLLGEH